MKFTIHKASYLLLSSFLTLFAFDAYASSKDMRSIAIDTVKQAVPECNDCVYFVVPQDHSLIKRHSLFLVSTVDIMPPPTWTVAIDPKSLQAYLLNPKELTNWNKVIRDEKLKLKSDDELKNLATAFLELAVGRAVYIDQLLPGESDRIQRKTFTTPLPKFQAIRNGNIFSISFYAKDVWGTLQAWDLTVEPAGTILKADVREF